MHTTYKQSMLDSLHLAQTEKLFNVALNDLHHHGGNRSSNHFPTNSQLILQFAACAAVGRLSERSTRSRIVGQDIAGQWSPSFQRSSSVQDSSRSGPVRVKNLSVSADVVVGRHEDGRELPTLTHTIKTAALKLSSSQHVVHKTILRNFSGVFEPGTITTRE
ncbi:hypothetical protein GN958_ATG07151 [Phytophthora infestans]|uniref:Uncharacterized protein n=1 Tax=Phytophthora infestans TaxID=4787 RepID=A0A8S9US98_PHYIN|nr:hypothetical protein GN958_ATG07151 [Phytophthora infestans]